MKITRDNTYWIWISIFAAF